MNLITPETVLALVTLTLMEIVLGIDNIIFIAIMVARLPADQQNKIRNLGIGLALLIRIALLFSISWVMSLQEELFQIAQKGFSGRDLILLLGGLFLVAKATMEIHHKMEDSAGPEFNSKKATSAQYMLFQILILDIVFSLDSVITAVGMANEISIMIAAMIISMIVMLISAGKVSSFVDRHPTIKVLALSFLLLIGVMLIAEGMGVHVSKGYLYFAMAFSLGVEFINLKVRTKKL